MAMKDLNKKNEENVKGFIYFSILFLQNSKYVIFRDLKKKDLE